MPIDLGFTQLDIYGDDKAFYYFVLAIFAVCVAIMGMLLGSPFGRTLLAIRENVEVHWSGEHRAALTGQAIYPRHLPNPRISCQRTRSHLPDSAPNSVDQSYLP